MLKNGCGWRDLPGEFPRWNTVHYYFAKWGSEGGWENINACLYSSRIALRIEDVKFEPHTGREFLAKLVESVKEIEDGGF